MVRLVVEDHQVRQFGEEGKHVAASPAPVQHIERVAGRPSRDRSEEHTSELQSLMRISYAVFCLKKKKYQTTEQQQDSLNITSRRHNTTNTIKHRGSHIITKT